MSKRVKPTHGPDNGLTRSLEPQRCAECGAELVVVDIIPLTDEDAIDVREFTPYEQEIVCPNGHEIGTE